MSRLVSVIVPSYNHAAFIHATLESIHAQSLPNLDVIVVDDGSTDNTALVLAPWRERGVRVIHQDRRGPSAARNRGIELACGEFIAFLDADDLWPRHDMLEAALAMFTAEPLTCWTFGDAQPFEERDGQRLFIDAPYLQSGGYYKEASPGCQQRKITLGDLCNNDRFFIPMGTLVIRKRCFEEVGGFDAQLKMFEDTDMWMRLLRFPVAFFPSVLLWRRVHDKNLSHRRWAHLDDLRKLFERYDLGAHGVSFDFHAARARYGAGREALRRGAFGAAAREFRASLEHRAALKPTLLYAAARAAAVLYPDRKP